MHRDIERVAYSPLYIFIYVKPLARGWGRIYRRGARPHSRFMAVSFSGLHCAMCKSFNRPRRADRRKNNIDIEHPPVGPTLFFPRYNYHFSLLYNRKFQHVKISWCDLFRRGTHAHHANYLQLIAWKPAATDLSQVKRRWKYNNNDTIIINSFIII